MMTGTLPISQAILKHDDVSTYGTIICISAVDTLTWAVKYLNFMDLVTSTKNKN